MISTVTSKGQITIPMLIRKRYGIHANDKIDFIVEGDRIILAPVKTLRDLRGAVTGKSGDLNTERQAAKKAVGTRNSKEIS
jgi:AbrB family looped-hinge helix DNA binding protein